MVIELYRIHLLSMFLRVFVLVATSAAVEVSMAVRVKLVLMNSNCCVEIAVFCSIFLERLK